MPAWKRWGICLLASSGPLPLVYGLAGLFDKTPAPWVILACVAASTALAALVIKPWRPEL